jgi:hypothetical protein
MLTKQWRLECPRKTLLVKKRKEKIMAKVTFSGKPATKPLFGISRGGLIPMWRSLGLPPPSSCPKKELREEKKDSPEPKKG